LCDDVVPGNVAASAVRANYTLRKSAGNWVSYYDFNEFRLYDGVTGTLIATAKLPAVAGMSCLSIGIPTTSTSPAIGSSGNNFNTNKASSISSSTPAATAKNVLSSGNEVYDSMTVIVSSVVSGFAMIFAL
jgi:hypothetical protein